MDSILGAAFVEHACNACGGRYRMTLYELLQAADAASTGVAGRPVAACHGDFDSYLAAMPLERLRALDRAWSDFERDTPDSLHVQVARPANDESSR